MSNWIVKYEPLCEITTFSKKKYFIKEKNREMFEKMMETNKFVKIWTSTINVSSIDTIEKATPEDNFLETELAKLDYALKNEVRREITIYKQMHQKDITPNVLKNMIKKYEQRS